MTQSDRPDEPTIEVLANQLYDELHDLAGAKLRGERRDHTLSPTALVHEAYMRLAGATEMDWRGRTHFRAAAAITMQRVLVDYARHRGRAKRGRGWKRVDLGDTQLGRTLPTVDLVDLEDAVERMRALDPRQARIVELRLYGGLTATETADMVGLSVRTVDREWTAALAWLKRTLVGTEREDGASG